MLHLRKDHSDCGKDGGLVGWTRRCATQIPFQTGSSCSAFSCHLLGAASAAKSHLTTGLLSQGSHIQ